MTMFITKKFPFSPVYLLCKVSGLEKRMKSICGFQGAVVAKSQAFDCHDPDVSGPDIFQKLVPMVRGREWNCMKRI